MNRLISARTLVASAMALGAVLAVSTAQARTDVTLVVGVNARDVAPVQYQPIPARIADGQRHGVPSGHDRDRFEQDSRRGGVMGDADRDGVPNRFDPDSRFYDARATFRHAQWGDFDRDGVVNQFDRAPRNPRRH
jgi:hypothetical protein